METANYVEIFATLAEQDFKLNLAFLCNWQIMIRVDDDIGG